MPGSAGKSENTVNKSNTYCPPKKEKERGLKKYIIAIGLMIVAVLMASCGQTESVQENQNVETFNYTGFAMGTVVTETIYSSGKDRTAEVENSLKEVENKWISWKSENSEIAELNEKAGGKVQKLSYETADCLKRVLKIAQDSRGAFDPTIGNITRLWDMDNGNTTVPKKSEINRMLKFTGYEKIFLDGNKVSMEKGISIDLGAAGKGMGCDEIKKLFEADESIVGAVITVGGSSIMTYGSKPDGSAWNVALTDPRDTEDFLGTLSVEGEQYISTSGDYEKYFMVGDTRYHHIMDPKTGFPSRSGLISTTIICDKGLESDALATACFVLGKEKGMELAEKYGAEAIFVDEDKHVYMTDGVKELFQLTKEGYQLSK